MLQKWHGSGSWYIQKGGWAERMINPGYQKERDSGHAGVKDRCQVAG